MAKLAENIVKAAVKLPRKDRARVVERPLSALEPEAEQDGLGSGSDFKILRFFFTRLTTLREIQLGAST